MEIQQRKTTSSRSWRLPSLGVCLAWLPALLVLLPLAAVALRFWSPGGEAWVHVKKELLTDYVWQTALLVGLVVLVSLILGVPSAWWVATRSFRGRWFLQWALVLPLAMPGYVAALAYSDVSQALVPMYIAVRQQFGVQAFLFAQDFVRWTLAVVVLAGTLYPYVYLTALASFSQQSAMTLEAARILGAKSSRVFWKVALPMARPALAAGSSLVAFEALNDFGVTHYFGVNTLTVGVFRAWLSEGQMQVAVRLAGVLLVVAIGSVLLERWQRGRRGYTAGSGETVLSRRKMSWWSGSMIFLLCAVPLIVGFAIPGWRLFGWAAGALDSGFNWAASLTAARHTFFLAGSASLLTVCAALLLTASRRAYQGGALGWAQRLGMLGYALPSALVAVGVGALFSSIAKYQGFAMFALSASTSALIFAYFTRFLAVGIQPLDAGFQRVSGTFHEASRTLGMGPWKTIFLVDLPLVWRPLIAGATLVFVDVFKELTLTLVLRPFNYETLATHIIRLTDESRIPEAAVPALILVGCSLLGLIPLSHFSSRRD